MTRGDGLFSSTYHMQVCVSGGAHPRLPYSVHTCRCQQQSDHHNGVGLYLQFVSYHMLGPPQEDLVSYLDLSWGYFQGENLLVFVAGV